MSIALTNPSKVSTTSSWRSTAMMAVCELTIATLVFLAYRTGRLVTNDSVDVATANSERVLDFQAVLIGQLERQVQQTVLDIPGAIGFLNQYYVFVHFPASAAFLVWAFVRRREFYGAIRNWFAGVTMAAMVIHVVFPLAPPRMMDGFVDTLQQFGPRIYPEDPSRSVANQFAAMPSLHFGWALMVAVGIIILTSGPRRWLWMLHPTVTLLAIIATGNHFLLDAVVAAALAALTSAVALRRFVPPRRYVVNPLPGR